MSRSILRIDASATGPNSATRALADQLIEKLSIADDEIIVRDLALGVPLLNADVTANMGTEPADRSPESASTLAFADQLIAELKAADVLVIGAPIYNFGVPAALKAWADLVARAGSTFAYTEQGPAGLLVDRPTYIVAAAGGTPIGSDVDHGTTWLQFFLGFLGIQDVQVIAAEGLAMDAQGGLARAGEAIAAIA
jgi:FMN-dependent NADH-azoreductase